MFHKLWPHKLGTLLIVVGFILSLSASVAAQADEVNADTPSAEQADTETVAAQVFLPLVQTDSEADVIDELITGTISEDNSNSPSVEAAAVAAATICPPSSFPNDINRAQNWSFETIGSNGSPASCQNNCQIASLSAAANWQMHSNNVGAPVFSELLASDVPGPGGKRMLHFIARGTESGVYQIPRWPQSAQKHLMFSVWVKVLRGQVIIQLQGGTAGPAAYSTKIKEWEQLRICTDGTVPTNMFIIYNQAAGGGEFYADRVEVRDMSPP